MFRLNPDLSEIISEYEGLSAGFLEKQSGWKEYAPVAVAAGAILGTREYYRRKAEAALREESRRREKARNAAALLTAGAALGYLGPKVIKQRGLLTLRPDTSRVYGGKDYDPLSE